MGETKYIKYIPELQKGIYTDHFNENFIKSISNGIICDCSRKSTVFHLMYKFKRHCNGKTHKKYLTKLNENNKKLDISNLVNKLEILDINKETLEKMQIDQLYDIPLTKDKILSMKIIADTCQQKIADMEGDWIIPKNNYENVFCDLLNWKCSCSRYYDAINTQHDIYIEIKKGIGGMWLDMIRYSEILLGTGTQDTVTVFFNWNKKLKRVNRIFVINTKILMRGLGLTKDIAKSILELDKTLPGRINHLQCMTMNQIKKISSYIINRLECC
jgi:hypothetical protein